MFASVNWTYVIIIFFCLLLFALFVVLFFIAERWGGSKAKPKEEKPKEKKPEEIKVAVEHTHTTKEVKEENVIRDNELNRSNLANDIQILIEDKSNSKKDSKTDDSGNERIFRSRLSNTGRMRRYYEEKHCGRGYKPQSYTNELASPDYYSDSDRNNRTDYEGITLTVEDMKRLQVLNEIIKRKSDEFDDDRL